MTLNQFYYEIIPLALLFAATLFVGWRLLSDLRHEIRFLRQSRYQYDRRYGPGWRYDEEELLRLEERSGIRLTPGARDMVLIPLAEAARGRRGRFPPGLEYASLETILRTMREDPSLEDRVDGPGNVRSSLSVIRAFWRNFCNIPPFCDGRERQ